MDIRSLRILINNQTSTINALATKSDEHGGSRSFGALKPEMSGKALSGCSAVAILVFNLSENLLQVSGDCDAIEGGLSGRTNVHISTDSAVHSTGPIHIHITTDSRVRIPVGG
jgi:hypothetical protein